MVARSFARWTDCKSISRLGAGLVLLVTLTGCSQEALPPPIDGDETSDDTADDTDDNGETTNTHDASPKPEPGPTCEVPTFTDDAEAEPFERLDAIIVDDAGDPVVDIQVQACGLNICLQGKTNGQGRATITGEDDIAKLAIKYGDGLHYALVALPLTGQAVYDLGEQHTLKFPAADPDNRFEGGQTLTSSDAELTLADDAVTHIDELSYADPSEHLFVAKAFAEDALPEAAADQDFVSVWAFGPAKTEFCPPATLSLPNETELEPGTNVELQLLVTDTAGRYGRYAEWTTVATGTVTDDGERIVTDAERGIPELGLVGVRLAE